MAGEDEDSEDPRAFTNQAAWKRALILAAGSFMNFLLGLIIVLGLYWNARKLPGAGAGGFYGGLPL